MAKTIGPPLLGIEETEVGDDICLFDSNGGQAVILNGTASDVWRLCDGEQTVSQIVDLIARAYGKKPKEVKSEVKRTIDDFVAEGFLAKS